MCDPTSSEGTDLSKSFGEKEEPGPDRVVGHTGISGLEASEARDSEPIDTGRVPPNTKEGEQFQYEQSSQGRAFTGRAGNPVLEGAKTGGVGLNPPVEGIK